EWNSPDNIAEGRAEKYGQQATCTAKYEIPEIRPHSILELVPELDAGRPQYQQPKDHHQRQIESAKRGRIQDGKGKVERAPGREKPYFVAVPDRTDSTNRGFTFRVTPA